MAESLLRELGRFFQSYSAGSHPTGKVNPLALKVLQRFALPVEGLRSKSWDEFAVPGAPEMDFVFTVCDNAAGEVCPIWPGQPITAHWGIPDPAVVAGNPMEQEAAFVTALQRLKSRISVFTALPFERLQRAALTARVREIGREEKAPTSGPELA